MKSNWQTKELGEVCDFHNGLWKGKEPPYVEVGVIRNTNFTKDGKLDDSNIACLDVERKQFEKPIFGFQGIQWMLADMATEVEAARGLVYSCAREIDAGVKDVSKDSAMAKLFASDVAMKVTTDAVQILGSYGYMKDYPVEKYMRDAKITQIYEGTNQIQRNVIALQLIKEMARAS